MIQNTLKYEQCKLQRLHSVNFSQCEERQPLGKPREIILELGYISNFSLSHRLHFVVMVGKKVDFAKLISFTGSGGLVDL